MLSEDSVKEIKEAVSVLKNGGVILYPTETVWGIGCDATNAEAVAKVFALKGRSSSKAMISLVSDIESLGRWVQTIPQEAVREISVSERPLTIVYDSPKGIASSLIADDGSAAFRIIKREYTAELCRQLGHPLVSTSANFSGEPTPSSFEDIDKRLTENVDFICKTDLGKASNTPSKILKIRNDGSIIVIRD